MPQDYSNLGLTYNLQSVNSLPARRKNLVTGYDFSEYERDAIQEYQIQDNAIVSRTIENLAVTNAKINDVSFNKATGGTLVLGGTNDVSGVFSLRNPAGSEVVGMNNNGITVTNGSIVVQNSSGGTVIDSAGIVSTTNFSSGNYYASNYISNSVGTVIGTITGSDLTISLTRTANVLFLSSVVCGLNPLTNTYSALVYISINGTLQNPPMKCNFIQSDGPTFTSHYFVSLASGTHTANLRWTNNLSGGTAEMWERRLTYVVLGT